MPNGSRPTTAFQNFLHCNTLNYAPEIALADVNVSCNPYFDVEYYAQQVADWANRTGAYGDGAWTAASVTAHIFNSLRMSLWEHFRVVGLEQVLNPSADFDTRAYLAARSRYEQSRWRRFPYNRIRNCGNQDQGREPDHGLLQLRPGSGYQPNGCLVCQASIGQIRATQSTAAAVITQRQIF